MLQWPCTPGAATADPQRGSLWNPREWCWSWRRTWSEGCSTHPVCGGRAHSGPSRCAPPHGRGPSPRGRCSPSCGTWHQRTPPQGPRRKSPGTSTPGQPTRITPGAGPGAAPQWHPRQRGSASRQPSNGTPTRGHATSCRRARSRPPRQTPSGDGTQRRRNRYRAPGSSRCGICPWAPWPTPLKPSRGLSRSRSSPAWPCSAACTRGPPGYGGRKEAGARAPISPWSRARRCSTLRAWGPWNGGRSCPARRAGGSQRPPHSPCDRRPSLAPQHAFTRDMWKAILSHTREWLTNPGARYPPGPVLEQLTAPTPGVRHALHRASALT